MQCTKCGNRIPDGSDRCPHCGSSVRFGGNTEFFGKAVRSNLRFRDVFSGVFQKQPKGAGEKLFLAGTAQTTPSESAMLREWNKPDVYKRQAQSHADGGKLAAAAGGGSLKGAFRLCRGPFPAGGRFGSRAVWAGFCSSSQSGGRAGSARPDGSGTGKEQDLSLIHI